MLQNITCYIIASSSFFVKVYKKYSKSLFFNTSLVLYSNINSEISFFENRTKSPFFFHLLKEFSTPKIWQKIHHQPPYAQLFPNRIQFFQLIHVENFTACTLVISIISRFLKFVNKEVIHIFCSLSRCRLLLPAAPNLSDIFWNKAGNLWYNIMVQGELGLLRFSHLPSCLFLFLHFIFFWWERLYQPFFLCKEVNYDKEKNTQRPL